jgi:hypothetical protein
MRVETDDIGDDIFARVWLVVEVVVWYGGSFGLVGKRKAAMVVDDGALIRRFYAFLNGMNALRRSVASNTSKAQPGLVRLR